MKNNQFRPRTFKEGVKEFIKRKKLIQMDYFIFDTKGNLYGYQVFDNDWKVVGIFEEYI